MAYVALYRRWRPQGFDALVGQDAVRIALSNALSTGRIAHAYLFAGPRGTGKTSTAKILAKALNCEQGPTSTPCNKCENCRAINDGSSMDVLEIDAASNRGIDEIRDLREKVMFAPVNGRYKVYIIDEVHMLTTEAFNALLKTLEEPPSHVVFILATTEPHKIPATIHSRCQRFDFKRVAEAAIVKRLREVADHSDIIVDDEALELIAIQSEGGMRDALSLLDQCAVMADKVTAETVRSVLGIVGRESLRALVAAIGAKNVPQALELFDELISQGKDARQIITEIAEYLRAVLLYQASPKYKEIYLTDTADAIERMLPFYTADRLMAAEERLHQALGELRNSVRARMMAELCLFDLCNIEGNSLAALKARVAELEKQLAAKAPQVAVSYVKKQAKVEAVPSISRTEPIKEAASVATIVATEGVPAGGRTETTAETPPPPPSEDWPKQQAQPVQEEPEPVLQPAEDDGAPETIEAGCDLWEQALEILKGEGKRSMVACAAGGAVTDYASGMLTVAFGNKFNCKRMNDDDYKTTFEEVLLRLARTAIRLQCVEKGTKVPVARAKAKAAVKSQAVEEVKPTELQPEVQSLLDVFGGTVTKL